VRRLAVPIVLTVLTVVFVAAARQQGQGRPVSGTVITRTTRIPAGRYLLKSADLDHPV
jgi:hypothetical protein